MLDGEKNVKSSLVCRQIPALPRVHNLNLGTEVPCLLNGLWPCNQAIRNAGGGLSEGGEE